MMTEPQTPMATWPQGVRSTGGGRIDVEGGFIRASTNGKVFPWWRPGISPQGIHSLVISGNE